MNAEAAWTVEVTPESITATDPAGNVSRVEMAELHGVMIETNDSGPIGTDLWWLLFGADDRLACAFPQGATGEEDAVNLLIGLTGFDHEAMIMAMGSTSNAVFAVWRSDQ